MGWAELGLLVGGAASALIGLLFVAVSIKIDIVARSQDLLSRAAQTLALLLVALLSSMLLVVPDQELWMLGVEVVALVAVLIVVLTVFDHLAKAAREKSVTARLIDQVSPNVISCLLLGSAGLSLTFDRHWGLYLLVPAFVALLTGGVVNAWLFLVRLGS